MNYYKVWVIVLSLLACSFRQSGAQELDGVALLLQGVKLTSDAAQQLEKRLTNHHKDIAARVKLLAYYRSNPQQKGKIAAQIAATRHLLWFIRNRPRDEVWQHIYLQVDRKDAPHSHKLVRRAWMQQLSKHPTDAVILGNAAEYFLLVEPLRAETLLKRAEALEPGKAKWPSELGELYHLDLYDKTGEIRQRIAVNSVRAFERAYSKSEGLWRNWLLIKLARAAFDAGTFDKASTYAKELLEEVDQDHPSGIDAFAIQHGNLVLGRLAPRAGNREEAKNHLLAAASVPEAAWFKPTGPNMVLAKELLAEGEREVVLEYFVLCGKSWKSSDLDQWKIDVQAGRTPDFGGNLIY